MSKNLVSTAWLAEHLHDEKLRIVDIRGRVLPATEPHPHYYAHRAEYETSHIPNALFVDWTTDIVEPNTVSYDIANPQRYADFMSRIGIGDDHLVIAYDDAQGMFAARLWWTMRYYGHEQVLILDGGWQKWLAEQRPTQAEIPTFPPAQFTVQQQGVLFTDASAIQAENPPLIDVRTPEEFDGKASRAKRFGHIPNAVNIPRGKLVTAEGTLKPVAQLKSIFSTAGIEINNPNNVFYCNGGVSASYGLLALLEAGADTARVYDGSWKDWGNDESKPIA